MSDNPQPSTKSPQPAAHNPNSQSTARNRDTKLPSSSTPTTKAYIVEQSNLLRNTIIQSQNYPFTFYSSYYTALPSQDFEAIQSAAIKPPETFHQYLSASLDDLFQESLMAHNHNTSSQTIDR
jgi:hypothetical protein